MNIGLALFEGILQAIITFIKGILWLFIPILGMIIFFVFNVIYYYVKYRYIEHNIPIKFTGIKPKKTSTLKEVLIRFPRQIAHDLIFQDPNDFDKFGIHMIVGEQGAGKSMTAIYLLEKWKEEFPNLKVYTNMDYKEEDAALEHWQELITRKNDKKGVVNVIDDFVAWWSNKDSKNLPPDVFREICQQRKQRKAIIGTVQSFGDLPKSFRKQTHFVYVPKTFMNSLCFVYKVKAKDYNMEKDCFKNMKLLFVYSQDDFLRSRYDTTLKIEKYKDIEWDYNSYLQECEEAPRDVE